MTHFGVKIRIHRKILRRMIWYDDGFIVIFQMFSEIVIKRLRNHENIENTGKMIDKPVTITYQLTRNFTLNPNFLVEMSHRYP